MIEQENTSIMKSRGFFFSSSLNSVFCFKVQKVLMGQISIISKPPSKNINQVNVIDLIFKDHRGR